MTKIDKVIADVFQRLDTDSNGVLDNSDKSLSAGALQKLGHGHPVSFEVFRDGIETAVRTKGGTKNLVAIERAFDAARQASAKVHDATNPTPNTRYKVAGWSGLTAGVIGGAGIGVASGAALGAKLLAILAGIGIGVVAFVVILAVVAFVTLLIWDAVSSAPAGDAENAQKQAREIVKRESEKLAAKLP